VVSTTALKSPQPTVALGKLGPGDFSNSEAATNLSGFFSLLAKWDEDLKKSKENKMENNLTNEKGDQS